MGRGTFLASVKNLHLSGERSNSNPYTLSPPSEKQALPAPDFRKSPFLGCADTPEYRQRLLQEKATLAILLENVYLGIRAEERLRKMLSSHCIGFEA